LTRESRKVIGAIDGSHIKILAPEDSLQTAYYNYKGWYSISLVAIVDNKGLFRWFCSGAPGSCGDSGVFRDTDFHHKAEEEQSLPEDQRVLIANGACILGDSAFREMPWLRTPIDKAATRPERYFNYKHSSMRFRVEHAFGRLKRKFRALLKGLDCQLSHCAELVDACVILHNFIHEREGWSPGLPRGDPGKTKESNGVAPVVGAGPAGSPRALEMEYLRRNFLLREWGRPGSRADRARLAAEERMRRQNGTSN